MSKSIGFGLERLGYFSLRHPKWVLLVTGLIYVVMSACASQLTFESDTRAIFRSNSAEFSRFDAFSNRYPGFLNETLILIEGDKLFDLEALDALRSLHLDLELLDNVKRVVSVFSARHAPTSAKDIGQPLVPLELDQIKDLPKLRRQLLDHPLIKNKLVSQDGNALVFVVTIEGNMADVDLAQQTLGELRQTVNEALPDTAAKSSLTGIPVFRTEIISSLQRDQAIFIALGLLIGTLLSYLFFHKIKYVVIVSLPGSIVMSTLLGTMWLTGQPINVLTSMVTPLVTVITLSNALHLSFAIRENLANGRAVEDAIHAAIKETGPSCVLSCLTTALALLTLTLSPLPLITNFGVVAVCGALLALFGMMLVLPALACVILKKWPSRDERSAANNRLAQAIAKFCGGAASAVRGASRAIALASVAIVALLGYFHTQNQPRYTVAENLPNASEASVTLRKIDRKFSGISRMRLLLEWPTDGAALSGEALEIVRDANEIFTTTPWIRSTWSLDTIHRWARSDGLSASTALEFVERNRSTFQGDLIDAKASSTVVTGYFPDTNSIELIPRLEALEQKLNAFRTRWPDVKANLVGVSRLEALTNTEIISTLNYSLQIAIIFIILLITLAMRSIKAGVVSVIPNLLPIAAGGTFLYLSGYDLQMTSVVAFTVGFGMAVDSTIHFIGRYKQYRGQQPSVSKTIEYTLLTVGPVLVVSTLVLISGLSATLLSELPMVQLYGIVSILVLSVALVADVLILPAILSAWNGLEKARDPSDHLMQDEPSVQENG